MRIHSLVNWLVGFLVDFIVCYGLDGWLIEWRILNSFVFVCSVSIHSCSDDAMLYWFVCNSCRRRRTTQTAAAGGDDDEWDIVPSSKHASLFFNFYPTPYTHGCNHITPHDQSKHNQLHMGWYHTSSAYYATWSFVVGTPATAAATIRAVETNSSTFHSNWIESNRIKRHPRSPLQRRTDGRQAAHALLFLFYGQIFDIRRICASRCAASRQNRVYCVVEYLVGLCAEFYDPDAYYVGQFVIGSHR